MQHCKKAVLIFFILFVLSLAGCSDNSYLEQEKERLSEEIQILENQKAEIEAETVSIKEEKGIAKYIITFRVKQSHMPLDFKNNIKDAMNAVTFDVSVDKEYYDSISVGDTINDDFRVGSLILKGSVGNWEITVDDKQIG